MHYFVKNPEINARINTIHQRVLEGRPDAEIADLLNRDGIKNMDSSGWWTEDQVEQIRWDYKLDSETPVTISEKAFRKEQRKSKPGIFWPILATIVALIYLILVYSFAVSEALTGSKLVVYLLAAILFPFLIVGLFQIFPRFRNKRPRAIIFFWVVLIMIFMNAQKSFMPVLPFIEGKQLPDATEHLEPVTSNIDKYRVLIKEKAEEGIVEAKRLYRQEVLGQPPVEETPEEADDTADQTPVEETPEKTDDAANQTSEEEAPEESGDAASQTPVEEAQEEVDEAADQNPAEEAADTTSQTTPVEEVPEEATEEADETADQTSAEDPEKADDGDTTNSYQSGQN